MMNIRAQLDLAKPRRAAGVEGLSSLRSRRSARRAYEKEHIKLTQHFARRFKGLDPKALTESERVEVLAAYDKLSRKWGIWG